MKKSLVWMIAIAIMVTLVAGTTFAGGGKEEAPAPIEETEEGIKYGGRFNVGFTDTLDSLQIGFDWHSSWIGCMWWPLVYDPLWHIGPAPNFEAVPAIAESWETEDGKTWTFHLREDATWHDGEPVTTEDVAFTIEMISGTNVWWTVAETYVEPGSVKIIDEHIIKFTMAKKVFGFYPPYSWTPILPKHIWEPYRDDVAAFTNDEAIGSGPFKLKEFRAAQYAWFVANEDYWRGRPYVDELVFTSYSGEDVRAMAMRKGEIDMMGYGGSSKVLAEDLGKEENLEVMVSPGILFVNITFNLHPDTSLRDLNVRKAIVHSIDRDRIIDMVYLGYAETSDSIMYPEMELHNPNLPQYDYDPDLAKKILNEGGYEDTDNDGIRNDPKTGDNLFFKLVVPTDWADAVKLATMVKEQLAEIGIDIEITVIDKNVWYDVIFNPEDDLFDITFDEQETGPNGDWIWEDYQSAEITEASGLDASNTSWYKSPEYDEIAAKMLLEADLEKRIAYLHKLQLILAEDLPFGALFRLSATDPVSKKFEGYSQGLGGISGWTNYWTYFDVHLK